MQPNMQPPPTPPDLLQTPKSFQLGVLCFGLTEDVDGTQRNNRYTISESLKALLYPLVLGLERVETTVQGIRAYGL